MEGTFKLNTQESTCGHKKKQGL